MAEKLSQATFSASGPYWPMLMKEKSFSLPSSLSSVGVSSPASRLSQRASDASQMCSYPPALWASSLAISGERAENVSSSAAEGSFSRGMASRSRRRSCASRAKKQGFAGL